MYITNNPTIAKIAEEASVDLIFVDMEFIGKDSRQGGLDTVQNHHTVRDVINIRKAVHKAQVLVRVNPIHEALPDYPSSEDEINAVIEAGADIVMLPYFKTIAEIKKFIAIIAGRTKVCLLVETPEAASILEQIIEIPGIDMIHIGLNDMHLALGLKFMFELLTDGSVEKWIHTIRHKNIICGFGGIASLHGGVVPGHMILMEHYRLGSEIAILSRSFCNTQQIGDINKIRDIFSTGVAQIREYEKSLRLKTPEEFENNLNDIKDTVNQILIESH